MTATEKAFLAKKIVEQISQGGRVAQRRGAPARTEAHCLFCGKPITDTQFLLLKDRVSRSYHIGCVHCGSPRELVPSVNPFMFSRLARRNVN